MTRAAVVYSDAGTFATSAWTETVLGGGDIVDTRFATGGNPDAWMQVQTIPTGAGGADIIIGAFINTAAMWDPSTQGALVSLQLSLDVNTVSASGQGQGYGIAIRQGANIYRSTFEVTGIPSAWSRVETGTLLESEFFLMNSLGNVDASMNPDFSGSPLELGFIAANSGVAAISGTTIGYDNWSITAIGVPEPASSLLLTFGLGFLMFRKRQRA